MNREATNATSALLEASLVATHYRLPHRAATEAITVEERVQIRGRPKWCVKHHLSVLNKDAAWEYEPPLSSRDDDFLARCRFDSLEEACAMLQRALAREKLAHPDAE